MSSTRTFAELTAECNRLSAEWSARYFEAIQELTESGWELIGERARAAVVLEYPELYAKCQAAEHALAERAAEIREEELAAMREAGKGWARQNAAWDLADDRFSLVDRSGANPGKPQA